MGYHTRRQILETKAEGVKRKAILSVAFLMIATSSLFAQTAEQCPKDRVPLMILGAYHMGNPGLDAVNLEADDVLSGRRQKEITELNTRLARFRPTKIAIEAARWSQRANNDYHDYLAGKYQLTRNEIDQIAYALGKQLGLKDISPVDFPMYMGGLLPIEQQTPRAKPEEKAAPTAPEEEPSPLMKEVMADAKAKQERLRHSTVSEYLAFINQPEEYHKNHRWDVISNLEPGDGVALYEKTDLATNWYRRNLRIFTNLLRATDPGDRVLLIIGNGHLHILKDLAKDSPQYCLVDTQAYLTSK